MSRRVAFALLALVAVTAFAGCGSDDDDEEETGGAVTQPPAGGTASSTSTTSGSAGSSTTATNSSQTTGETNDKGQSVSGQVVLTGDLEGTFTWNPDLAVDTCFEDFFSLTMSDGKDTFIALETNRINDTTTLTSGKLANTYTGPGAELDTTTSGAVGEHLRGTVTFDTTVQASQGGGTIHISGTLTFEGGCG